MDISLSILGARIEREGEREGDVDLFGCSLVHIHIQQVSFMGFFWVS